MATTSKMSWEDGPIPLIATPFAQTGKTDPYTHAATEMALLHNCIIRSFNSVYIQAPLLTPDQYQSFIHYAWASLELLEEHHDGEEAMFFPELERQTGEKGLMDVNISQHEAFHSGLDSYKAYLKDIIDNGRYAQFSPKKLVALMDDFVKPLGTHLHEEIPSLMALSRYGDKINVATMLSKQGDEAMAKCSKTKLLPVVMLNHDTTFEGGIHNFPPAPWLIVFLLRKFFPLFHWSWWRYSACDSNGEKRELWLVKK